MFNTTQGSAEQCPFNGTQTSALSSTFFMASLYEAGGGRTRSIRLSSRFSDDDDTLPWWKLILVDPEYRSRLIFEATKVYEEELRIVRHHPQLISSSQGMTASSVMAQYLVVPPPAAAGAPSPIKAADAKSRERRFTRAISTTKLDHTTTDLAATSPSSSPSVYYTFSVRHPSQIIRYSKLSCLRRYAMNAMSPARDALHLEVQRQAVESYLVHRRRASVARQHRAKARSRLLTLPNAGKVQAGAAAGAGGKSQRNRKGLVIAVSEDGVKDVSPPADNAAALTPHLYGEGMPLSPLSEMRSIMKQLQTIKKEVAEASQRHDAGAASSPLSSSALADDDKKKEDGDEEDGEGDDEDEEYFTGTMISGVDREVGSPASFNSTYFNNKKLRQQKKKTAKKSTVSIAPSMSPGATSAGGVLQEHKEEALVTARKCVSGVNNLYGLSYYWDSPVPPAGFIRLRPDPRHAMWPDDYRDAIRRHAAADRRERMHAKTAAVNEQNKRKQFFMGIGLSSRAVQVQAEAEAAAAQAEDVEVKEEELLRKWEREQRRQMKEDGLLEPMYSGALNINIYAIPSTKEEEAEEMAAPGDGGGAASPATSPRHKKDEASPSPGLFKANNTTVVSSPRQRNPLYMGTYRQSLLLVHYKVFTRALHHVERCHIQGPSSHVGGLNETTTTRSRRQTLASQPSTRLAGVPLFSSPVFRVQPEASAPPLRVSSSLRSVDTTKIPEGGCWEGLSPSPHPDTTHITNSIWRHLQYSSLVAKQALRDIFFSLDRNPDGKVEKRAYVNFVLDLLNLFFPTHNTKAHIAVAEEEWVYRGTTENVGFSTFFHKFFSFPFIFLRDISKVHEQDYTEFWTMVRVCLFENSESEPTLMAFRCRDAEGEVSGTVTTSEAPENAAVKVRLAWQREGLDYVRSVRVERAHKPGETPPVADESPDGVKPAAEEEEDLEMGSVMLPVQETGLRSASANDDPGRPSFSHGNADADRHRSSAGGSIPSGRKRRHSLLVPIRDYTPDEIHSLYHRRYTHSNDYDLELLARHVAAEDPVVASLPPSHRPSVIQLKARHLLEMCRMDPSTVEALNKRAATEREANLARIDVDLALSITGASQNAKLQQIRQQVLLEMGLVHDGDGGGEDGENGPGQRRRHLIQVEQERAAVLQRLEKEKRKAQLLRTSIRYHSRSRRIHAQHAKAISTVESMTSAWELHFDDVFEVVHRPRDIEDGLLEYVEDVEDELFTRPTVSLRERYLVHKAYQEERQLLLRNARHRRERAASAASSGSNGSSGRESVGRNKAGDSEAASTRNANKDSRFPTPAISFPHMPSVMLSKQQSVCSQSMMSKAGAVDDTDAANPPAGLEDGKADTDSRHTFASSSAAAVDGPNYIPYPSRRTSVAPLMDPSVIEKLYTRAMKENPIGPRSITGMLMGRNPSFVTGAYPLHPTEYVNKSGNTAIGNHTSSGMMMMVSRQASSSGGAGGNASSSGGALSVSRARRHLLGEDDDDDDDDGALMKVSKNHSSNASCGGFGDGSNSNSMSGSSDRGCLEQLHREIHPTGKLATATTITTGGNSSATSQPIPIPMLQCSPSLTVPRPFPSGRSRSGGGGSARRQCRHGSNAAAMIAEEDISPRLYFGGIDVKNVAVHRHLARVREASRHRGAVPLEIPQRQQQQSGSRQTSPSRTRSLAAEEQQRQWHAEEEGNQAPLSTGVAPSITSSSGTHSPRYLSSLCIPPPSLSSASHDGEVDDDAEDSIVGNIPIMPTAERRKIGGLPESVVFTLRKMRRQKPPATPPCRHVTAGPFDITSPNHSQPGGGAVFMSNESDDDDDDDDDDYEDDDDCGEEGRTPPYRRRHLRNVYDLDPAEKRFEGRIPPYTAATRNAFAPATQQHMLDCILPPHKPSRRLRLRGAKRQPQQKLKQHRQQLLPQGGGVKPTTGGYGGSSKDDLIDPIGGGRGRYDSYFNETGVTSESSRGATCRFDESRRAVMSGEDDDEVLYNGSLSSATRRRARDREEAWVRQELRREEEAEEELQHQDGETIAQHSTILAPLTALLCSSGGDSSGASVDGGSPLGGKVFGSPLAPGGNRQQRQTRTVVEKPNSPYTEAFLIEINRLLGLDREGVQEELGDGPLSPLAAVRKAAGASNKLQKRGGLSPQWSAAPSPAAGPQVMMDDDVDAVDHSSVWPVPYTGGFDIPNRDPSLEMMNDDDEDYLLLRRMAAEEGCTDKKKEGGGAFLGALLRQSEMLAPPASSGRTFASPQQRYPSSTPAHPPAPHQQLQLLMQSVHQPGPPQAEVNKKSGMSRIMALAAGGAEGSEDKDLQIRLRSRAAWNARYQGSHMRASGPQQGGGARGGGPPKNATNLWAKMSLSAGWTMEDENKKMKKKMVQQPTRR